MNTARKEFKENQTTEIEKDQSAVEYKNFVEEMKSDAQNKPAEYLSDSVVPAGGE